ncbi:LCP family protein [Thermotoga caldifontis]|uniref:LCP family protein n=1 Tax=Thermotoga caldifontis TaxID=1508419 RepID=UPI000597D424|nr:LCP family protein [Thermotoga caldifontis]
MKLAKVLSIVTLTVILLVVLFLVLFSGWLFQFFLYRKPQVNPYSLLVVGVDAAIQGTRRADVIMIALVDHEQRKILISNVPRDLLVGNSKINAIYARSRIPGLKQTLSKLLDIDFNGAVIVDYAAFKYLGDELGPVEIHVKEPMKYSDSVQKLYIDFQPGVYQMRGDELLAYIRYRKDAMGDLARIERQKEVLMKLLENARHVSFQKLLSIFNNLQKNIDLRVSTGELVYLFSRLRKGFSVEFLSFPYAINEKGDVILDEKKLQTYKQALKEMKVQQATSTPRIILMNATVDKTRGFLEKQMNLWNEVGVEPSLIVWEDLGLSFTENSVLVLNAGMKESLEKLLSNVYPDRKFTFISVNSDPNALKTYFDLIDRLSKNRIYPRFPIDALVVVR